ncbi:hypothetical protein [Puia dinghuensis]|uniref:Lipoprotein n=1 Tax=Puia dinghuensis TaxID=1792502 RepID=A0A8J2UEM0_9BACT|nr:hypothetical protein [Puia dinghuensis]GGB04988.1 hypothetical protein GCM10011511_30390 [Puia dinghuensis]
MTRRLLTTVGLSVLLLSGTALLFHSCKKQDQTPSQQDLDQRAKEKALVSAMIAKKGLTFFVPVNQRLEAYYVDQANHRIPKELLMKHSTGVKGTASITSACDFSNTPVVTISSYAITTNCEQGFSITWNYTISTNNNIVAVNPTVTTAKSKGLLRIVNSSNSQIYTENDGLTTLQDMGPDNSNPGYELFSVSFTSSNISITDFASGNSIKLGANLVTDCPDVEPVSIAITTYGLNGSGGAATNPCDRLDAIQIPSSTSTPFHIYGEDPVGTCVSGFIYPDLQEIQYSLNGGAWSSDTTNTVWSYYLPPTNNATFANLVNNAHQPFVDPTGSLELQLNLARNQTYNVSIRYRNIMFNGTLASYGNVWPLPILTGANTNCCVGPWSTVRTYTLTY